MSLWISALLAQEEVDCFKIAYCSLLIPANTGSSKPVISDIMLKNVLLAGCLAVSGINNFIIEQFILDSHPVEHLLNLAYHSSLNLERTADENQSAATFSLCRSLCSVQNSILKQAKLEKHWQGLYNSPRLKWPGEVFTMYLLGTLTS